VTTLCDMHSVQPCRYNFESNTLHCLCECYTCSLLIYCMWRSIQQQQICQITLVQEGTIVRTITRLDELMREVRNSARVVGDPSLYRKMEATSQLIKRGVIFCGRLVVASYNTILAVVLLFLMALQLYSVTLCCCIHTFV
jgi:superfamily II RNA helicase